MINSGWILPDLYEVKCKSCSTLNGHVEVVKRYLENLKKQDEKSYNKIINAYHKEASSLPSIALDDFAVMQLNWIKINNDPIKIIFYTYNNDLDFIINRYINIGYYPIVLDSNRLCFLVDIPSSKLI